MSDLSVAEALRSDLSCVVIEAPAGTGKTFQAAEYARDVALRLRDGERVLILAHTHAACDVFSTRVAGLGNRARVGTFDSLIFQIASAYHAPLGLPADVQGWSIDQGPSCFAELARMVSQLMAQSSAVTGALAARYPVVICDEHQDASDDQHAVVSLLVAAGSRARFFGDPMQVIFGNARQIRALQDKWRILADRSDAVERLDAAHRWASGSPALGEWVLHAREMLRAGHTIDLRLPAPVGLRLLRADNLAPRRGMYSLSREHRRQLDAVIRNCEQTEQQLLILSPQNDTVRGLHAFWGRRIPIWEGHTRGEFDVLVQKCRRHAGDPIALGEATCAFLREVGKGFTQATFGNVLVAEIRDGCSRARRGKPSEIQGVARLILENPNHVGVGLALDEIRRLVRESGSFAECDIDLRREFDEARKLHSDADISSVLTRVSHQRRISSGPRSLALSTVHKSKGLETRNAIVVPCDVDHFADNEKSRCLLYVALSRACGELVLVVPTATPSALLLV